MDNVFSFSHGAFRTMIHPERDDNDFACIRVLDSSEKGLAEEGRKVFWLFSNVMTRPPSAQMYFKHTVSKVTSGFC